MPKRLEEIFSVQRLRKAWSGENPPSGGGDDSGQTAAEAPLSRVRGVEPLAVFEELVRLVRQRFPDERGEPFVPLLSDLEEKLRLRFPGASSEDPPEKEREALNQAIEARLIEIEDLVEALDLAKPH